MREPSALSKIVNQSGFPLQLGIDHFVSENAESLGWSVLYREHGWKHTNGETGFADLVLEDRYRTSVLVIECKRVLDSDWLFLEEAGKTNETLRTRVWINYTGQGKDHAGYFDLLAKPDSPSSMYCIVAGQDQKTRPLLERVAAETASATEAIAAEELPHIVARSYGLRMYASVIVTTARLTVSSIDPNAISLKTGEVPAMAHREVPWIRFRKQLAPDLAVQPRNLDYSFSDLASAREKCVFVINSEALGQFLRCWDIISRSLDPLAQG